jgi:hypothetical protein
MSKKNEIKPLKQPAVSSSASKVPKNVKCNCGHTVKDHYRGGWCHSSGHPKEGQCGCTWFHPNDKWILMNNKRKQQS